MLEVVRSFHTARLKLTRYDVAKAWLEKAPFLHFSPPRLLADLEEKHTPTAVIKLFDTVELAHPDFDLLNFCNRTYLDDECMDRALGLIASETTAIVVKCYPVQLPITSEENTSRLLKETGIFDNYADKTYIGAVNMAVEKHWCGYVVHTTAKTARVLVFDSLNSYHNEIQKHLRQVLRTVFPLLRITFGNLDGVDQFDTFNCGVFVLMAIEAFLKGVDSEELESTDAPDVFRFRYLARLLLP